MNASSQVTTRSRISNLYHLFTLHNVITVLADQACRHYITEILANIDKTITERVKVQYIAANDIGSGIDLLFPDSNSDSALRQRYDLFVVGAHSISAMLPVFHRARYLFIYGTDTIPYVIPFIGIGGNVHTNDLHSICFDNLNNISMYEKSFVRDVPFRFMVQTISLVSVLLSKRTDLRIVEIGACTTRLRRPLMENFTADTACTTFFLCQLPGRVLSIDISEEARNVIEEAANEDLFEMNSTLVCYKEEAVQFLKKYCEKYKKRPERKIDVFCLDAFSGPKASEKNLTAYTAVRKALSKECLILVADTDENGGGKGSLIIPEAIDDGFTVIFQGRMTLLYKGSLDKLYKSSNKEFS